MRTGPDMKVRLAELPAERHFDLGASFVGAAVEGLPLRDALERPPGDADAGAATADLELYMEGRNVFVRGTLGGWVEVACSRCVGPARCAIDESLAVTYLPAADPAAADHPRHHDAEDDAEPELELGDEDLDVYAYEGEEIDLEPLLRDQIILSVPFAPLCRPDCKGLCPVCGAELNVTTCSCAKGAVDPRWDALRQLKE